MQTLLTTNVQATKSKVTHLYYQFDRRCNAGQSSQWKHGYSSRSTGSHHLWQWAAGCTAAV